MFEEGELDEKVFVSKMEITSPHGAIPGKTQSGEAMFYNLDAIISVGYRVNSKKATRFRTISRPTAYGEYAPYHFGDTGYGRDEGWKGAEAALGADVRAGGSGA